MKIWRLGYKENTYTYSDFSNTYRYVRNYFRNDFPFDEYQTIHIEDSGRSEERYDLTRISAEFFIVSLRTLDVLEQYINDKARILPLQHPRDKIFAMHVYNRNNCLNYEKAQLQLYEGKDLIKEILEFSFHEASLMKETIFKLPRYVPNQVFVTDLFRQVVLDYKLTGFEFEEIWGSDSEAIPEETCAEEVELIFEGEQYSFDTVLKLLDEGHAFANKDNKVQLNQEGNLMIGMYLDASKGYHWIQAVYFPPGFIEKKWYKVERENF